MGNLVEILGWLFAVAALSSLIDWVADAGH